MLSSDRDILISINGKLERIESRLDSLEARASRIEERVTLIERRLDIAETKLETLQTSVYWGFAIMGLIFAFVGLFVPSVSAVFTKALEFRHDSYEQRRIREIVHEEIEQALKRQ